MQRACKRLLLVVVAVAGVRTGWSQPTTSIWNNPAGGSFHDANNWIGGVPDTGDTASHEFLASNPYTVSSTIDFGLKRLQAVSGLDSDSNDVTYDLNGHELVLSFSTSAAISVTSSGAPTRLALTDGDYTVEFQSNVQVLGTDEDSAELALGGGATLTTRKLEVSGGTLTVDNATLIHEATLDTAGAGTPLLVGELANAKVVITNGATLSTNYLLPVAIGNHHGEVRVDGGATLHSSQVRLGEEPGSTGVMNLDGPGTELITDFGSFVGYGGSGELNVTGGASARFLPTPGEPSSGFLGIGRLESSSGVMTVSGAGSVASIEGAAASVLSIGRNAPGALTVSEGGLVTTVPGGDIAIGRTSTGVGVATVTGAGSILRGHNGIAVGGTSTAAGGAGTLHLTNGGSIEASKLVIYSGDTVNVNTGGFGTIGTVGAVVNTPNTLTVRTGGTLRGIGTINGNVANTSGGELSPGLSPGKLTINGLLDQGHCVAGAGGTFNAEINAAGTAGINYDTIQVSGDVLLGGTLNLLVSGTYVPNGAHQFNLITGSNHIEGAFESITNRVITPGIGGRVWGDYRDDGASPNADRYYVAPRRQADFNGTGGVSGADYTIWADNYGKEWATFGEGDANGDRIVSGADYTIWADNFGQSSIGDGEAAVSAYGYGVDLTATKDISAMTEGNDIALGSASYREVLRGYGGSINAVPEPSSMMLGGLALIGLLSTASSTTHRRQIRNKILMYWLGFLGRIA